MEVRDPIYGLIKFDELEERIINTSIMQRLRNIHQLALAYYVYPSARHTRFEHSIGVMHLASIIADALCLEKEEKRIIRLVGLLHDIGHGPFSHISEQILECGIEKSLLDEYKAQNAHELISILFITYNQELSSILDKETKYRIIQILQKQEMRSLEKDIISGPLDADKLDYLLRDSYFAGVRYGIFDIDKLTESLCSIEISSREKTIGIKEDGVFCLEQMLLAKYHMTSQIYKHRIRRITDAMVVEAVKHAIDYENIPELRAIYPNITVDNIQQCLNNYLKYNDYELARVIKDKSTGFAKDIFMRLENRRLFKEIFAQEIKEDSFKDVVIFNTVLNLGNAERKRIADQISEEIFNKKLTSEYIIVDKQSYSNPTYKHPVEPINMETIWVIDKSNNRHKMKAFSTIFSNPAVEPTKNYIYIYAPLNDIDGYEKREERQDFVKDAHEHILKIIKEVCKNGTE